MQVARLRAALSGSKAQVNKVPTERLITRLIRLADQHENFDTVEQALIKEFGLHGVNSHRAEARVRVKTSASSVCGVVPWFCMS